MSWFNDDLDRIDAHVFSGDTLESLDNRKELKTMCELWLRAIAERENRIDPAYSGVNLPLAPTYPHCLQLIPAMPTQQGNTYDRYPLYIGP